MTHLRSLFTRIACLMLCMGFLQKASAQIVYSSLETGNMFQVQLELIDSSPLSLEEFSYNVLFIIPNGTAPGAQVEANFGPELEVISNGVPTAYGTNTTVVTTTVQPSGTRVNVTFPNSFVGPSTQMSFPITVRFPLEKACHGLTARSWATLKGSRNGGGITLTTSMLYPVCQVNNPWRVQKTTFFPSFVFQGANSTCQYGTFADTNVVGYQVKINKTFNDTLGSVLLSEINLTDLVGSGQIIATGFQVAEDVSPFTPIPGFGFTPGGQITFPPGFQLNPFGPNYRIRFNVQYPTTLSTVTCLENIVVLEGKDPCDSTYTTTSSIKVKRLEVSGDSLVLTKTVSVTGNVPGCTGKYTITIRNPANATSPLYYNLADTLPDCIIINSITVPTNGNVSGTEPYLSLTNSVGLAANSSHTYVFHFTIGPDCVGTVTNSVTSTGTFQIRKEAKFHMLPDGAKPCITKSACSGNNYALGDTIRYRIRIQNIGNTIMSGAIVTDILDPANLEFVGNMVYYQHTGANIVCGNGSIPGAATPLTGVNFTILNGNELKWEIPDLEVDCSPFSNLTCGGAANARAYFIEFSVRVKDTAAIGSVKNLTTISGGNILNSVSNSANVNILGVLHYNLTKGVSESDTDFTSSINSGAGSTVYYNLQINNYGTGISQALLMDLLPNDNGSNDNLITFNEPRSPAGSFDIDFMNFVSTSHAYSQAKSSTLTGINTTPELGVTVNTTGPSWTAGLNTGASNFQVTLDQTVSSSVNSDFIFTAKISEDAKIDSTSCNTFAMRAMSKRTSSSNISYLQLPAIESLGACVTIDESSVDCCEPIGYEVPEEVCVGDQVTFCAIDDCEEGMIEYSWYVDGVPVGMGECVTYTFTAAGEYHVVVKWINKCGKEGGKEFKVVVKECPCKVEVGYEAAVNGMTVTATANTVISGGQVAVYTWDMGNGVHLMGQSITYTYPQPGMYEVVVRVYALNNKGEICECTDKCGIKIEVAPGFRKRYECGEDPSPTGPISVNKPEVKISAAPNPFVDRLTVSFEGDKELLKGNFSLEMMNANGAVVLKRPLKDLQKPVELDTRNLISGLYFVLLKDAKGTVQGKQVVKLQ